ncbi:MAG: DNA repair protein RecO [Candidatus Puniceispirillum sp.]
MPEWIADAVIISVKPHGEGSAVVIVLTAENGRHAGLVRGGNSSKMRGILQPGNRVRVSWRARLIDQLGQMQIELVQAIPALMLDDPLRLAGIASACALLDGTLPEREAQYALYGGTNALFDLMCLDDLDNRWIEGYVRWELGLLNAAGYQLDLTRCAASGAQDRLAYVSPKSGCAIALDQAGEYVQRMLTLPVFLGGVTNVASDYVSGLNLTGHFLEKRVFAAHNQDLPVQRRRLADMVSNRYNQTTHIEQSQ